MNQPTQRAGRPAAQAQSAPPPVPAHHAPHAALLIDFDNVTLGIRSDLTKELRTLLNSEIIRGKVAVQRAYADWRRYPQYIVPLSESSIDLIFAPAFGTNKKNATDIRLAVDATELVFTRPEIGTFILLSGDSDFSSLVIKLKEYGKYVIGVGIRESASDLLIQNCDEYYSYSDLAGLTKEADVPSIQRDPWELVVEAAEHMSRSGDVMRSDRLKQVMQHLDPNFDERNAGFSRFSKFVVEVGTRGLLKVTKLDNGQFEVAPLKGARGEAPARPARPARPVRGAEKRPAEKRPVEDESRRRGRSRGRGTGAAAGKGRVREGTGDSARSEAPRTESGLALAAAFQLVTRALAELPNPVGDEALRARMAALHGREDPLLDPSRFARLLRQANDAEVADVRKLEDGSYEVSPHQTDLALARGKAAEAAYGAAPAGPNGSAPEPTPRAAMPAATHVPALRFRRGSRSPLRSSELSLVGVVQVGEDIPSRAAEPDLPDLPDVPDVTVAPEAKRKPSRGRGRGRAKPSE